MSTIIFFQVFAPFVAPQQVGGKKVLLLVDGHTSHETMESIEFCVEAKIEMFELPPHMTHCLQPLDVGYYGPLKVNWNDAQKDYLAKPNNKGKHVTRLEFGPLCKIAWDATVAGKGDKSTENRDQSIPRAPGVEGVRNSFE